MPRLIFVNRFYAPDHSATAQILTDLESEGVRLLAARRSAGLIYEALQGKRYVPRL